MVPKARALLVLAALGGALVACGSDAERECLRLPCPIPLAITISVSAATGGPVVGVSVETSGAVTGSAQCTTGSSATLCYVMGVAGTYDLKVGATGFGTVVQTVTVQGSNPACGCPTVVAEELAIVLTATQSAHSNDVGDFGLVRE